MTTRKMLETDAKIRLQNAGFAVRFRGYHMDISHNTRLIQSLKCTGGTVNAGQIEAIIALRQQKESNK